MFAEKYFLISDYESMELLGVNGLFTNMRVDRNSLPEGFYKYSLREGEDDFFSSVKSNVLVNHMGDFICKQELDLKDQDELDLDGEYSFTNEDVDLDEFFGEDIKMKIAQEIDDFSFNFDTYEYKDRMPSGATREDAVEDMRAALDDKSRVNDLIDYFKDILSTNQEESFLEPKDEQKVRFFVSSLVCINSKNRESLDNIVDMANKIKETQTKGDQDMEPEIHQ